MNNQALGNIEAVLKEYIAEEFMFDRPSSELSDDLSLIREGIIDSLGIFMLVSFIDEKFDVKVESDDIILENFETVTKIRDLIIARQ